LTVSATAPATPPTKSRSAGLKPKPNAPTKAAAASAASNEGRRVALPIRTAAATMKASAAGKMVTGKTSKTAELARET
jgi:hypothetical protein